MLPPHDNICFLGSLTYNEAAQHYKSSEEERTRAYVKLHKALNGGIKFWEKGMVGFPCKLR